MKKVYYLEKCNTCQRILEFLEWDGERQEIRTEKIYDQGNSYKLKGVITKTASGMPLFDTHGNIKLIHDSTSNRLKIVHLNRNIFSPEAGDHSWKSWEDRHDSSYTIIQK